MNDQALYERSTTPDDASGFDFTDLEDSRISTGSPGADIVLNGGFLSNTINLIIGQPGSGKTIFSQQMMYGNAPGLRGLYVSTLSEPQGKVVRFVQKMSFFRRELLRESVSYHSVGDLLREHGATKMPVLVADLIEKFRPNLLVIDSFKAVRDLSNEPPQLRRMMHELASLLTSLEITSFLVGEYGEDHYEFAPEFTVADSIVELLRRKRGLMDERFFRVHKFRGSDYHAGMHATSISGDGLHVYPRLVTPPEPQAYKPTDGRVPTGVPGLDDLVGGGFWRGSTSLVMGTTGAGKTSLGLQFILEGLRRDESVLYVNFQENPIELQRHFDSILGEEILSAEQLASLHLIYKFPIEMHIDSIVSDIMEAVTRDGVRRVVIDAIDDLEQVAESTRRLQDFLFSISETFMLHQVTTVFTLEGSFEELHSQGGFPFRVSQLSDTLITLTNDVRKPGRRRLLRVVKSRNSEHTEDAHPITLNQSGVSVASPPAPTEPA